GQKLRRRRELDTELIIRDAVRSAGIAQRHVQRTDRVVRNAEAQSTTIDDRHITCGLAVDLERSERAESLAAHAYELTRIVLEQLIEGIERAGSWAKLADLFDHWVGDVRERRGAEGLEHAVVHAHPDEQVVARRRGQRREREAQLIGR